MVSWLGDEQAHLGLLLEEDIILIFRVVQNVMSPPRARGRTHVYPSEQEEVAFPHWARIKL